MATQGNQIRQTFVAAAVLPQYTFVRCNGATADGADRQVVAPTAAQAVDGVVINQVMRANTAATVVVTGRTKVLAGGAIAAGANVTTNAAGRAITAATGNIIVGKALEAGVNNQIISIDFITGGNAA